MNPYHSELTVSTFRSAIGFAIIELAKERKRKIQLRGKDRMKYLRLIQEWRTSTASASVER